MTQIKEYHVRTLIKDPSSRNDRANGGGTHVIMPSGPINLADLYQDDEHRVVSITQIAKWDKIASLFDVDENGDVFVLGEKGLYSLSFISAGRKRTGGGGGGDITLRIAGIEKIGNNLEFSVVELTEHLGIDDLAERVHALEQGSITLQSLTINVGGTQKAVYNPSAATTVDITAADLGLTAAMKFEGVTTSQLSQGSTTNPIYIDGQSFTASKGSTVVYNKKEFVWTGSHWQELGDEGSWALKTVKIKTGGYLTGGGTLEADRTLDIAETYKAYIQHGETAFGYFSEGKLDWNKIKGAPTKLSEFIDDILSGKYLPLNGGTITGDIYFDKNLLLNQSWDTDIQFAYLGIHPEKYGRAILPFFSNDLAFLQKKGGSAVSYFTDTSNYTLSTIRRIGSGAPIVNFSSCFDGSAEYCFFNVDNLNDKVVIDLTLHKYFPYGNVIYIDFGNTSWCAKDVTVLAAKDSDNYTIARERSNVEQSFFATRLDSDENGINRIRIVLTNFVSTKPRIGEIGLIAYNSLLGRETFMSRGMDDDLFRNLIPHANNSYDLGSSINRWKVIYAKNANIESDLKVGRNIEADGALVSGLIEGRKLVLYGSHIFFTDISGIWTDGLSFSKDNNGVHLIFSNELRDIISGVSILPSDNSKNIGDNSHRWGTVYADKINLHNGVEMTYDATNHAIRFTSSVYSTGNVAGGGSQNIVYVTVDNDLIPSANNTYKLGNVTYHWTEGYIDNITATSIQTGTMAVTGNLTPTTNKQSKLGDDGHIWKEAHIDKVVATDIEGKVKDGWRTITSGFNVYIDHTDDNILVNNNTARTLYMPSDCEQGEHFRIYFAQANHLIRFASGQQKVRYWTGRSGGIIEHDDEHTPVNVLEIIREGSSNGVVDFRFDGEYWNVIPVTDIM